MTAISALEAVLDALCEGKPAPPADLAAVPVAEALSLVARYLSRPMRMDRVERLEGVFKRYLSHAFAAEMTGSAARFVAGISRDVGLLYKFKPYGVKCANALGYSIFFLWPGMGFSFQRHRSRKTELFHMLKTLDRGQVWLSTSREWDAVYQPAAFNRWLDGENNAGYAAYSRRPDPGDVFLVTELDTVHSVLGCVLEEYATVSTDMVDRLHDQNTGRDEVPMVEPAKLKAWLADLPSPLPVHCYRSLTAPPSPLAVQEADGVRRVVLADTGEFFAERFDVETGRALYLERDGLRARSLFCLGGDCRVYLRDPSETTVEPLPLQAGQTMLIGPGITATIEAVATPHLSSHTIRPELALDA